MFLFHMLAVWVKYQKVGITILINLLKEWIVNYLGSLGFAQSLY